MKKISVSQQHRLTVPTASAHQITGKPPHSPSSSLVLLRSQHKRSSLSFHAHFEPKIKLYTSFQTV